MFIVQKIRHRVFFAILLNMLFSCYNTAMGRDRLKQVSGQRRSGASRLGIAGQRIGKQGALSTDQRGGFRDVPGITGNHEGRQK